MDAKKPEAREAAPAGEQRGASGMTRPASRFDFATVGQLDCERGRMALVAERVDEFVQEDAVEAVVVGDEKFPDWPTKHAKHMKGNKRNVATTGACDGTIVRAVLESAPTPAKTSLSSVERTLMGSDSKMNYWILKTNPRYNDPLVEWIVPETTGTWHTRRIPKNFAKGDKVILWQSGSGFRVIAFGRVTNPFLRKDENGNILFRVLYSTGILEDQPDIVALRKLPLFDNAGFLKPGPADTIFKLSVEQGEYLYRAADLRKRTISEVKSISAVDDLDSVPIGSTNPDRASGVTSRFKRDITIRNYVLKRANGVCEYCGAKGFRMADGRHYLEAHHVIALGENGPDTVGNVIGLCPNHHREAHFGLDAERIEKKMIRILRMRK